MATARQDICDVRMCQEMHLVSRLPRRDMVVIILLVSKKSVMGAFGAGRPVIVLGWIATAVMGAAAVRMFIPG